MEGGLAHVGGGEEDEECGEPRVLGIKGFHQSTEIVKTKTRTCLVLYLGLPSSRGGCAMVA